MQKGTLAFCLVVGLSLVLSASASVSKDRNQKPYRVVCYLGSWANYRHGNGKFLIENIDPHKCTHLIYGFAKLENNMITAFDSWLDLKDNWGLGAYERFNGLRKQNPQLTTLIAIGGWNEGSSKYSLMASKPESRKIFVDSVLQFLHKHDFDGLDFDWEYPGSREGSRPEDKENFLLILKELRDAFKPKGYLLTSAVSAGRETIDLAYAIPKITQLMDFINIMTYDFHGSWEDFTGHNAPLYARPEESESASHLNTDYGVNYWLKNGADGKKLVLGMPLYGRCFTLRNPSINGFNAPTSGKGKEGPYTRDAGFLGYNEICEMFQQQQWAIVRDQYHVAPYTYRGDQWCGYDDVQSIAIKTDYLKSKGLSGGMIWSLETDDFLGKCFGKKYPLLSAINDRLNNIQIVVPSPPPTLHPDAVITDSGPATPKPNLCKNEGSFPYENDCTRYYQCIVRPWGYEEVERKCPPGTGFDPKDKRCNFISQVPGCGANPVIKISTTEAVKETTHRFQSTVQRRETTIPTEYTTIRIETTPAVPTLHCPSEGLFPHPTDCKSFYKCGPGLKGYTSAVFTCPLELYYNPTILSCDYPDNVDCHQRLPGPSGPKKLIVEDKTSDKAHFVCMKTGLFPHPTKCYLYYQCVTSRGGLRKLEQACPMRRAFTGVGCANPKHSQPCA